MRYRIALATAFALVLAACASSRQGADAADARPDARTVAVTIDDLPYVGDSLADATAATARLLAALDRHGAAAAVFVEGRRVEVESETAQRMALLRRWRDAGHAIANHGYGHPSFNDVPVPDYLADVDRGWAVVEQVMQGDRALRQFRAPFNHTGATGASAQSLLAHLAAQDMRLTPFTVDHADWLFNAVYEDALARADDALARRIGEAYLAQLDRAFDFAEALARDTFARDIPQVFLIHANRINDDHLGAMLDRLRERGYVFVSMEEAMRDEAYASDSAHVTRWGISWLHRWRADRDLPDRLRDEPEPPAWISQAHAAAVAK